ncbi:hypothetical protein EVAR_74222_1 [Eumeta japonica]|uniref:Uncharacterized protein n=1 Tax=Eumeta variegata TaxID=151549 RepID=A0A4C1SF67_EUMVA|nr:hypothetical protein EVAR_74222_1 [Eumeta japonica]
MFEDDEEVKIKKQSPAPPDYEFEKRSVPKKPRLWNVKTQPVKFGQHFPLAKECKQRSISNTSHQKVNTHRGEAVLTSSRDIFESPSNTQDAEIEPRTFDWKLTPDENVMRKIRERYFGRSDF